ncbi:MAG: peptidoglycan binding domain-containing protein, partial [Oscillospiraceae bacterium]|nr:peptidoglycan binding domain-containing protein [Oscillospiraceae bacterium]
MAKRTRGAGGPSAVRIVAIVIAAVIVIAAAAVIAAGFKASNSGTIFPKVKANGVPVGGMTKERAAIVLTEANAVPGADDSVKLTFSDGTKLEITCAEAGLAVTPEDAAELAYKYGRGGNFFSNAISYLKCTLTGGSVRTTEVSPDNIDEANVRKIISESTSHLNKAATESAYRIEGNRVIITKGATGFIVSEDEVYTAVFNALKNKDFKEREFKATETGEVTIDLDAIYNAVHTDPVSAESVK